MRRASLGSVRTATSSSGGSERVPGTGWASSSFQALQAPSSSNDYALLGRIVTGSAGERMLAGWTATALSGLGLVPEHLRYPLRCPRYALASPEHFAGARVRVRPSGASGRADARAGRHPGARQRGRRGLAVADGKLDGAEASLGDNSSDEGENHLTANLPLFPKTLTLFANDSAYDGSTTTSAALLRDAARADRRRMRRRIRPPSGSDARLLRRGSARERGRGERGDVATLEDAAQPVYDQLEKDPDTRALIAAIRGAQGRVGRASRRPCRPRPAGRRRAPRAGGSDPRRPSTAPTTGG